MIKLAFASALLTVVIPLYAGAASHYGPELTTSWCQDSSNRTNICDGTETDCFAKGKTLCDAESLCFGVMYNSGWSSAINGVKLCTTRDMVSKSDWITIRKGEGKYHLLSSDDMKCRDPIASKSECEQAAKSLDLTDADADVDDWMNYSPVGCYFYNSVLYFNTRDHDTTTMRSLLFAVCKSTDVGTCIHTAPALCGSDGNYYSTCTYTLAKLSNEKLEKASKRECEKASKLHWIFYTIIPLAILSITVTIGYCLRNQRRKERGAAITHATNDLIGAMETSNGSTPEYVSSYPIRQWSPANNRAPPSYDIEAESPTRCDEVGIQEGNIQATPNYGDVFQRADTLLNANQSMRESTT